MDIAPTEVSKPHEGHSQVKSLPQATAIRAMDAHPSRDLVAVSGLRQAVFIQPSSGKILGAIDTPLGNVTALRFSRDGKLLLAGVSQPAVHGTVFAFDVESGKVQWQIGDETDSILAMDLSIDGKTLAVGGPSRTVRLYNVSTGEVVHSLKKHTDWILTLQFSPDGLLLASGDRFGAIFVWDPKQGSVFQDLKDHTGAVQSIAWDQDGETLVSGGKDGFLRTWNLHHGQRTSRWDAQVGEILSVSKGPSAIVATGRRNRISAWNSPESSLATIELSDQGEAIAFCNDKCRLIATDASGKISTVDLSESRVIQCITLPVDTDSATKLVQRIERANAAYRQEIERRQMMERSLAMESTATASDKSATLPQPSVSALPVAKLQEQLRLQIESGKQQLETVTTALKHSNESLANLARLNQDLVSLVGQSSQIQAQMAGQIAEQSKLLQAMQERLSQLEATLSTPQ
jgi:PQQ-like domain/WD domain, G-beta repeat